MPCGKPATTAMSSATAGTPPVMPAAMTGCAGGGSASRSRPGAQHRIAPLGRIEPAERGQFLRPVFGDDGEEFEHLLPMLGDGVRAPAPRARRNRSPRSGPRRESARARRPAAPPAPRSAARRRRSAPGQHQPRSISRRVAARARRAGCRRASPDRRHRRGDANSSASRSPTGIRRGSSSGCPCPGAGRPRPASARRAASAAARSCAPSASGSPLGASVNSPATSASRKGRSGAIEKTARPCQCEQLRSLRRGGCARRSVAAARPCGRADMIPLAVMHQPAERARARWRGPRAG